MKETCQINIGLQGKRESLVEIVVSFHFFVPLSPDVLFRNVRQYLIVTSDL